MEKKVMYKDIQDLQIWYRVSGLSLIFLLFMGIILFFSINQSILDESRYVLLVLSTIMYITVPTLMNMFLSIPSMTPSLLEELNKNTNRYRWLEYFFSSSIMMIVLGLLVGITSSIELALLVALNSLMILLGAFADWFKPTWQRLTLFGLSSLVFSYYWLVIIHAYIANHGGKVSDALVSSSFAQLFLILLFFCSFPLLFLIQHFGKLNLKITTIDKLYIVSGFVAKSALFVITLLRL